MEQVLLISNYILDMIVKLKKELSIEYIVTHLHNT